MRIAVTADLHLEITEREAIEKLVAEIAGECPDAVVLAGDLGNPSPLFEACLAMFADVGAPVAVMSGNHDLWVSPGETSTELFKKTLPEMTRAAGMHWLDGTEAFLLGSVGIAGSNGWYDYSARDHSRGHSDAEILAMKEQFAWDAKKIDWPETDQQFAAGCRDRLRAQLDALEANDVVRDVLVVTHVPVFPCQMDRRPHDDRWTLGNPFFGHFTMGEEIASYSKVRRVVSGHTHVAMAGYGERPGGGEPIPASVIDSDYHRPGWVMVEFPA